MDGGTAPRELIAIAELAAELGVTQRAIRFYEAKGLVAPARVGAMRVYTRRDRARLRLILRGKRLGFSLREIAEYLDLYDGGPGGGGQLRLLLDRTAARIAALEQQSRDITETLAELRAIEAEARARMHHAQMHHAPMQHAQMDHEGETA